MKRRSAFTLVELFVVFAAVILLASVLIPVLRESRSAARIASCKSHQKKVSRAILAYTEDYDGAFPYNGELPYYTPPLDWALRVGRVPDTDEDLTHSLFMSEPNRTICITGYVDYNYASYLEGVFKCPAFIDQVEPKATWAGACSSHFSMNENLCGSFDEWDEVVVTRISDVRPAAVMIGDGNLSPGGGIVVVSSFLTTRDGKLLQRSGALYDFGPWTHQEHVNRWQQTIPCDFYGHTKEKAILTYVSGHTRAVRDIVHEQWQITEPESE